MALASLSLPSVSYSFDSDGTAIVPVTAGKGKNTLGKIEIQSPLVQMSEFFSGIDKSLIKLVEFAKKSFSLEEKDSKKDPFKGLEDKPTKEKGPSMLDTLKGQFESISDAFNQVSIGEKLSAALMIGALALFVQFEETIVFVIDKLIGVFEFVRDKIFGGGPNASRNTLLTFLGLIAAFKVLPLIKATGSALFSLGKLTGANKLLGKMYRGMLIRLVGANGKGGMIRALGTLSKDIGVALLSLTKSIGSTVFKSLNYVGGQLVTVAKGLLRTLSVGLMGSFTALGKAFTAMKVFIMTRMVPAIMGMIASMVPALILAAPFIIIGLKVAAIIGTILFGLKKAFDTFKEAVEDGDSMYAIIGKTISSFFGNIIGLIPTLVKNLAAFIVGLFGFTDLKEKMKNMDIGQMISDALFNLTNTFLNFIKAISLGAVAAFKAAPLGGESPTEAFKRVYNEVIDGKTPNIKREQVKDAKKEGEDGDEKFVQTEFMTNTSKLEAVFQDKTITNSEMLKKTDIINKLNTERKDLEDKKAAAAAAVVITNNKQGDTINQKSETYNSTQLNQNNTDLTDDLLNASA
jgi:hypothetical protein